MWTIKKFAGGSEVTLTAKITMDQQVTASHKKEVGPISMAFEIPMFNVSHLQVWCKLFLPLTLYSCSLMNRCDIFAYRKHTSRTIRIDGSATLRNLLLTFAECNLINFVEFGFRLLDRSGQNEDEHLEIW